MADDTTVGPGKGVFSADGLTIFGPRADGSFRVCFTVGEYQYNQIKDLPNLNGKVLVVAVVQGEDLKNKKQQPVENPEGWQEKSPALYGEEPGTEN